MILEKETFIAQVMSDMDDRIPSDCLIRLRNVISERLHNYQLEAVQTAIVPETAISDTARAIKMFFVAKKIEGLTDRSLNYYKDILKKFFAQCRKNIKEISTDDVRFYLATMQIKRGCSKVTCNNERRVLSSFFHWCEDENYISRSPLRRIQKIKEEKIIKQPFTDEELERIRDACADNRELAIIDVLASTGMRVGEMAGLGRNDVNMSDGEIKVFGKGQKERLTFLNAKAKLHLKKYLDARIDDNPAVFISKDKNHRRISEGGIELIVHKVGKRSGVRNVHPHRFRRTAATQAINRGMPIEQVQIMLGHENIETTTRYAIVNRKNVKLSHEKYIT